MLDGVFPRGITPSDVDGVVEINSRFLWLEWKSETKRVPKGQLMMLTRRTQDSPKDTVFIIFGPKYAPTKLQIIRDGKVGKLRNVSIIELRDYCDRWARWAEAE